MTEQNKTDWSEKRFQIVLKLMNKKQDGTYLDCKQIEEQADELMRYLQQFKDLSYIDIRKGLLGKIAQYINHSKDGIQQDAKENPMYYQSPYNEAYAQGCQFALSNMRTYINKLLDDSRTN